MKTSSLSLLLFAALFALSTNAQSLQLATRLDQLEPVGSGKLTWFGMRVYTATLLTPDGAFDPSTVHALRIDYNFSFSRQQLAKTSLDEIEKLYGEKHNRDESIKTLETLFIDVESGDHLIGLHTPGKGAVFFNKTGLLGTLDDSQLAREFFDIWLHPKTSQPSLRQQLLGFEQ